MFRKILIILLVFFIQSPTFAIDKESKTPLLNELESYKKEIVQLTENTKTFTLSEVLSIGLNNHPKILSSILALEASKGKVLQSSLYINPKISFGIENILGLQSMSGLSEGEFTLQVSQQILLGGKLENRYNLASAKLNLQESNNKILFLELFSDIKNKYIDFLASQEYLKLTKQLLSISSKMLKTIKKKADSGKISYVEVKRANIICVTSEIEYKKALLDFNQLSKALSTTIGINTTENIRVKGNIFLVKQPPELNNILKKVFQNLDLENWDKKVKTQESSLKLEKSKRIQNLTLSSGLRYLNGNKDYGITLGVSYPISVFNSNQGNIISAENNLQKLIKDKDTFLLNLKLKIIQSHLQLSKIYTELEGLENIVIPEAEKTFISINKGYQYGKFDYLDVLDAQRTLFNFKNTYINLLTDFQKSMVTLERTIGESIVSFDKNIQKDKERK